MGIYTTGHGQTINGVHSERSCYGEACTIHQPSDHPMADWPTYWDAIYRRMMRKCVHGRKHPDPDEINTDVVHHCDGCCDIRPPEGWKPNPGSERASEAGCQCARMDNGYGRQPYMGWNKDGTGNWSITVGCPVHYPIEETP